MPSETVNELTRMSFRTDTPRVWDNNHDSLQAIADTIDDLTPQDFGTKYYVDWDNGDDTNDGTSPEEPFKTQVKANTTAVAGDIIKVRKGSYLEDMDWTKDGITVIYDPGALCVGSGGALATLTVSGDYIKLINPQIVPDPTLATWGFYWSGNHCDIYNLSIDTTSGNIKPYRSVGDYNRIFGATISASTTDGFEMTDGSYNYFSDILLLSSSPINGFSLEHANVDYNMFVRCKAYTLGNPFNIVAGANYNTFVDCGGNSEPNDLGTGNVFINYSIGSQIVSGQSRDQDLKDIYDAIISIVNEKLVVSQQNPSMTSIDEEYRFECVLIDNDSGPIASGDITAGTYDLIRVRAGVPTTLVSGGAFSKANGRVYIDITFSTASWNPDDTYILQSQLDTTVAISGTTYYPAIGSWVGLVSDLSNLETKIDNIQTSINDLTVAPTTGSHDVTTANDTSETTIVTYTPSNNREIEFQLDIATLETAGEGGTITLRLKQMIDGSTPRIIDTVTYLVGTDEVMPTVKGRCRSVTNGVVVTVQCSTDVTATRACPYVLFEGGA